MDKVFVSKLLGTLNIPLEDIDFQNSFVQNGGDSLKATSLVNRLRTMGIPISREMILTSPSLNHLSDLAKSLDITLLDPNSNRSSMESSTILSREDWQVVLSSTQKDSGKIGSTSSPLSTSSSTSVGCEDDFVKNVKTPLHEYSSGTDTSLPATEMQLGLIHGTLKNSQMNVIRFTMLHRQEDIGKIHMAWKTVLEQTDIFDTTWVSALTGTHNPRFLWIGDSKQADEFETAKSSISSHFSVQKHPQWRNDDLSSVTWTVHHAFIDGISAQILLEQVLRLANGYCPDPTPSFWQWAHDFQHYQRAHFSRASEFWTCQHELHPEAKGALQLPKPETVDSPIRTITLSLQDMQQRLVVTAKQCNVTLATVFYAAWALVLSSFSDSNTVVFGALLSGRNVPIANSDRVIGPLINSLPFYVSIEQKSTIQEFLASVFRSLLDLEQFSWTTSEHGFTRDYDSTLSVETWQDDWSRFDIHPISTSKSQQSGVPLGISVTAEGCLQLQYHADRLRVVDAERIAAAYEQALEQITRVHTPVEAVMEAIVTAPSRTLLTKFGNCISGRTTRSSVGEDLVTLFNKVVRTHPEAIAVDDGKTQVTYREFDNMTSHVAARLSSKISEGDVVCVHSDKSVHWIVAIFSILKAGGVYSSLDPGLPPNLRATMFKNAGAKLFLTPATTQLCSTPSTCNSFDSVESILSEPVVDSGTINRTPKPWSNAYLCFTSGTTGTPKGVVCTHEGLVAFQSDLEVRLFARPGVRISQTMSVAFDGSIHEIFSALTYGATLVLPSTADPFGALESAHAAILTPSIARVLNPDDYPLLKWVYLVGEPVSQSVSDRWSSVKTLYNMYGPTEGTGGATIKQLTPGDSVTIGRPNPTTRIYILDSQAKLAQPGMIGEIYIAGVQVARGYVGLDKETKERFLPDTIMRNGETMYRTGDRGYWNENGEICCLGRNDRQIKLRGFRLDLNDLEIRIARAAPEITGVAIARKEDELVAFIQPSTVDSRSLKVKISSTLPRYAMPHHLVAVDKIPMTPAGKVDYRAVAATLEMPSTEQLESWSSTQRMVSDVFSQVLGLTDSDSLTLDSDFIALGGHSLKQIRLVRMMTEKFKTRIPLQLILTKPSIRGLAESVETFLSPKAGQIKPESIGSTRLGDKVSPIEHEWLVKYQSPRGTASFNVCFSASFDQVAVDKTRLAAAWNQILQKHAILSSRFQLNGETSQRHAASVPRRAELVSGFDNWKECNRPFDLAHENPIRVLIARDKLLVTISHAVADYTTLLLLLEEATQMYHGQEIREKPLYANTYAWPEAPSESIISFWKDYLKDIPEAPSLLRNSPSRATYQGRSSIKKLGPELGNSIRNFTTSRQCSKQQLAIAAVSVCLQEKFDNMDMIVGVPYLHRQTEDDLHTIGLFLQPLAVRIKHNFSNRAPSFLQSIQCSMQMAVAHATCWNHVVDALGIHRQYPNHPIFDIMVTFLDESMMEKLNMDIPSFDYSPIWSNGAKFKLMCEFMTLPTGDLVLRIEYDDSCIPLSEVEGLACKMQLALRMLMEGDMDFDSHVGELVG
ncbi:hypothetical protein ACHAPJ_011203 [Fusarium lateritium]